MKKLVAEVVKFGVDRTHKSYVCIKENGEIDRGITDTLLSLVELVHSSAETETAFKSLLSLFEQGIYKSPNTVLPDWGFNDVNIWLGTHSSYLNLLYITNENTVFCDDEEGGITYTLTQIYSAIEHWKTFNILLTSGATGESEFLGKKFEIGFCA